MESSSGSSKRREEDVIRVPTCGCECLVDNRLPSVAVDAAAEDVFVVVDRRDRISRNNAFPSSFSGPGYSNNLEQHMAAVSYSP
mmetsp:Transcript_19503/g.23413  ORF Transcript_19503/g.23413 Transcript_19503/m.23413 type:complete len:84 (-) Transcript_19503:271-522(-)|eukprot:CAMPEP_0195321350 /NCGR_PEP_ID=MMETSP0708-20121125/6660_1 /TAXON_ID=33640 /ORGANISM="Asterionellopsis glacialis, Strain CCMP134" /LENGTH=83 /DNA_ID=CAMNT_0040387961 /DNA_START=95 /DNA_END=346 /DNA_ORIENTATION=-